LDFVVLDARRKTEPKREDWSGELATALAAESARSLLLVDVDGHERLVAADGRSALQRAERALVRNLVDDATMVRESLGRYWVVSGCERNDAATAFARRLGDAVAGDAGHLGVPLSASIGVTLVDAGDVPAGPRAAAAQALATELCGRAEEAMLRARAAGGGVEVS
jgi:GGDEF domain-containing protein